jgi:DHA1 family inner membrane transport protein
MAHGAMTVPDTARTNWPLVLLIWIAGLGAAAQYGKISVIFDRLPEIYPDAGAALGFVLSLVGAVGILLGVVAGVFVARIGYRRALLAGLIVGAAMSFVQAFWPPLPVFFATRLLEGAAHLLIVVAAPTLIAELAAPSDQGRALTLWGTFFGVALAILGWFGVPLAHAAGPGALMMAHGAFMLVMAAILLPRLPTLVARPRAAQLAELLSAHRRIYTSPRIGAPAVGWLFYTICFLSALTLLPPFVDPDWRGFVIGAIPLLSILSSMTLGVALLRCITAWQLVTLGFVVCAASIISLMIFPGDPFAAMGLGVAIGLVQGATFASVPELNEAAEARSLANGGLAQMGNLGNTIGTPVMLIVIAATGYGGFMTALLMLFLVGAAAHLLLARQR